MNKNPNKRFGFKQIRSCSWFGKLDWDKLERKEVTPPWQPDQRRANCDGSYDLDEQFEVKRKRSPLTEEQEALLKVRDRTPWRSSNLPTIVVVVVVVLVLVVLVLVVLVLVVLVVLVF